MEKDSKILKIEGARIIFRNFSGKKTDFNREGDRNFCLVLDEKTASTLRKDGWNVKELRPRDPEDDKTYYIQVAVKYSNRPPKIYLVAGKKPTLLDEANISVLDTAEIKNVDITINPYHWEAQGKSGIKAYANTMYVTIEDDPFREKYEELENDEDDYPF